jgi:F-type H+-transporting ATPase subunit b
LVQPTIFTLSAAGQLQIAGQPQVVNPPAQSETVTTEADQGPSPIAPEGKELLWGAGAFIVLLILMRLVLFPRVKKGMDARYGLIRDELETADATRAEAAREVAEYEAELAKVRAEAAKRIDAARVTLEGERQSRLAEVNAGIGERRVAAAAEAEAAKARAQEQIVVAASNVAASAAERVLGRPVDPGAARPHVESAMSVGSRS